MRLIIGFLLMILLLSACGKEPVVFPVIVPVERKECLTKVIETIEECEPGSSAWGCQETCFVVATDGTNGTVCDPEVGEEFKVCSIEPNGGSNE